MNAFFLIFKYIWFIGVLVGVLNTLQVRYRVAKLIRGHPEWEEESRKVLKNYFLFYTLPPLFLGLFQLAGGYNNPFYILSSNVDAYVALSWCVLFLTWSVLFRWVFFHDGAQTIIKYRLMGPNMPASEPLIKAMLVLMLAAGICALVFGVATDIGGAASQIFAE